jgi:hypothetical protein
MPATTPTGNRSMKQILPTPIALASRGTCSPSMRTASSADSESVSCERTISAFASLIALPVSRAMMSAMESARSTSSPPWPWRRPRRRAHRRARTASSAARSRKCYPDRDRAPHKCRRRRAICLRSAWEFASACPLRRRRAMTDVGLICDLPGGSSCFQTSKASPGMTNVNSYGRIRTDRPRRVFGQLRRPRFLENG